MDLEKNLADREWRFSHLYRIRNKQRETVPLKLNAVQRAIKQDDHRFPQILKPRQVGVSTLFLIDKLDAAMYNRNYTCCVVAHEMDAIRKLFRVIRFAYDNIPDVLKPALDKGGGSMYELRFPQPNSKIYVDLESRSETIDDLHISEIAFMKNMDKVNATIDSVPVTTGRISVESTANGLNDFYDRWQSPGIFKNYFFPWYFHEEYELPFNYVMQHTDNELELIDKAIKHYNITITDNQIAWRRFKIGQRGRQGFLNFIQEYPEDDETCFLLSGGSPIDRMTLKDHKLKTRKPRTDGAIRWYKEHDGKSRYVIGADPAEGSGGDFSAAVMLDPKTMDIVATIKCQLKPYDFAEELERMAKQVPGREGVLPLMAVERNNHGHAVIQQLNNILGYPNLYVAKDDKLGWLTSKVTRPVMVTDFIDGMESHSIGCPDTDLISECLTLVNKNGKIEAEQGKHDDLFIAGCIATQMAIHERDMSVYDNIEKKIRI